MGSSETVHNDETDRRKPLKNDETDRRKPSENDETDRRKPLKLMNGFFGTIQPRQPSVKLVELSLLLPLA